MLSKKLYYPDKYMYYHSASRLKTLNTCKKLFYHQYILEDLPEEEGPYAILGSALHRALELYRKNPTEKKDLYRYYSAVFLEHLPRDHFLFKEGLRILAEFKLSTIFRGELVGVEIEFDETISGHRIKGVIDKVERLEDGTLLCTDYKSNKTINTEQYVPQLAIYDVILGRMYPQSKREHELLYLRHNKSVPIKFTEQTEAKVLEILSSVANLVNENVDKPWAWPKLAAQDSVCQWCPLKQECWG